MEKTITLDGTTLSPSEAYIAAKSYYTIQVSEDSWQRIIKSRKVIDEILQSNQIVYGINTGFGSLVNSTISKEDLKQLQVNLVRSHATGLGELMSEVQVRAMMISRINSFACGFSGVHPNVVQQLIDFVNSKITPLVPRIGSLGASGDLAPLSHMALALIGEGNVLGQNGDILDTREVLMQHA